MIFGALLAAGGCAQSEAPTDAGTGTAGCALRAGGRGGRRHGGSEPALPGTIGSAAAAVAAGGATAGRPSGAIGGQRRARAAVVPRAAAAAALPGAAAALLRAVGGNAGSAGRPVEQAAARATVGGQQRRAAAAAAPVAVAGAGGTAGLGGGSLCTAGRFLLCEGFEGPVGNTPPSGWSRQGNATIADDQAARGAHALKLTPAADKGYGFFVYGNAESFGAAHWGRLFYRVQTPPPDAFVHATMAAYQGDGPGIGASTFRVADTVKMAAPTSTHQFLFNVQITGDREFGKGGPYNWSFDGNWHCAEWFVDGANQAYQFYFDGSEVTQIRIQNGAGNYGSGSNDTHLPMMFNDFRVGWTTYQTAPPGFTAWIDEVAIDAQRIGCGN